MKHPLLNLLAERAALVKEGERLPKLKESTDAEIGQLLETSAIDDPKSAQILSALRTRSELVPVKIRQIEDAIDRVDVALRPVIVVVIRQLNVIARREAAALRKQIHAALKEFITELPADNPLVGEVFHRSGAHTKRIGYLDMAINRYDTTPAAQAAQALVTLAEAQGINLADLPPPPEPPGPPVEVEHEQTEPGPDGEELEEETPAN